MSDRVAILVVVIFVICGFIFLSNLNQQPGKISPAAKLIDFGGLAKMQEAKREKVQKTQVVLTSDLREYLAQLKTRREQIEQERLALINNRAYILEQLMALNGPVEEHVKPFIEVLEQERKQFTDRLPELEKIAVAIEETFKLPTVQGRQEKYQKIKAQVIAMFDKAIKDVKTDIPRLKVILGEIERIITAGKTTKISACEDNQKCLDESIGYIKDELDKLLDDIVETPNKKFTEILDLTRVLAYENKILLNNSIGTEERLEKGDKFLQEKYQELVESLVDASDEDLLALMASYKKVEKEYLLLLKNLDENRLRFYQAHKNSSQGIKLILNDLAENSRFDVSQLVGLYENITIEKKNLLYSLENNEKAVNQMIIDRLEEKYNTIFIIADTAHIDLEKILEEQNTDINSPQPVKPRSMANPPNNDIIARLQIDDNVNYAERPNADIKMKGYDDALLKKRQEEVNRQMKREVEEARRNGFYDQK